MIFKKMNRVLSNLVILLGMILIFSCSSEEELPIIDLRPDFVPHVDQYIEEAAKRGINVDFNETGLSIKFSAEDREESIGICFLGQHRIEIDRADWNELAFNEKEGLIFHELGHCDLGREHLNRLLSNGEWASRMRGIPFVDDAMSSVINYSGRRREYYIDELFNENTQEPEWVNITQEYDFISDDQRNELLFIEGDTVTFMASFALPGTADFEIELEMDNRDTEEFIALVWGQDNNDNSFRIGYNKEKNFIIRTGQSIWGTLSIFENFELINSDTYNKLTVRQIQGVYYVFVNEEFIYWFDSNGQSIGTVQSLEREDVNHFRNVRISGLVL